MEALLESAADEINKTSEMKVKTIVHPQGMQDKIVEFDNKYDEVYDFLTTLRKQLSRKVLNSQHSLIIESQKEMEKNARLLKEDNNNDNDNNNNIVVDKRYIDYVNCIDHQVHSVKELQDNLSDIAHINFNNK